jgi:hypothetical protein
LFESGFVWLRRSLCPVSATEIDSTLKEEYRRTSEKRDKARFALILHCQVSCPARVTVARHKTRRRLIGDLGLDETFRAAEPFEPL